MCFTAQLVIFGTAYHANYKILQNSKLTDKLNMNLGKGSQLSQRWILLLSARLTETRGEKKRQKNDVSRQ